MTYLRCLINIFTLHVHSAQSFVINKTENRELYACNVFISDEYRKTKEKGNRATVTSNHEVSMKIGRGSTTLGKRVNENSISPVFHSRHRALRWKNITERTRENRQRSSYDYFNLANKDSVLTQTSFNTIARNRFARDAGNTRPSSSKSQPKFARCGIN